MGQLAATMGYGFERNDVSVMLYNQSLCGSAWQQADTAAKAAGIAWGIENDTTLWITLSAATPRVITRQGSNGSGGAPNPGALEPVASIGTGTNTGVWPTPVVSAETGLVSYPTIDAYGVTFRCLFRPDIRFMQPVQIVSSIPRANHTWLVSGINHHLQSNTPNGAWFSECRANWIPQTTTAS